MCIAIELKNVCKSFRKKEIYRNVNLKIKKGRCVGFIGKNGTGKSVLFQIITGLIPANSGEIIINGNILGVNSDFPDDVGILINSPGYIDYYNGFKNLQLLAQIQNKIGDEKIKEVMELVGLDPNSNIKVKEYSMGMKQKLGIAQAIMENQEIIILDEPYNALDFAANKDITILIKKLKANGKTILLTSHQHEYLEKLCDDMYYIENGCIKIFDEEIRKKYFDI